MSIKRPVSLMRRHRLVPADALGLLQDPSAESVQGPLADRLELLPVRFGDRHCGLSILLDYNTARDRPAGTSLRPARSVCGESSIPEQDPDPSPVATPGPRCAPAGPP
jgi:hypothetical protein